jgi:ketosteroid isomerase-like protein
MLVTHHPLQGIGRRWAGAEMTADVRTLDELTTDNFVLVGPFGFILDKQQWLDRYRSGALVTTTLDWHDVTIHDYGTAAVSVGVQTQVAAHRGQPNHGSFRVTHMALDVGGGQWRLAAIHLSPMPSPTMTAD